MKNLFSLFYLAIVLNGCILVDTPPIQISTDDNEPQTFGSETYIWNDWSVSGEVDNCGVNFDSVIPAIP